MAIIKKPNLWLAFSILIIFFATAIRFYNFSNRINFGPEQAISLITSAEYKDKFSLLGQPDLIRNTSTGFIVFQGAWFNYSLVPLQTIFKHDVVLITAFFALLNIITGVLMLIFVTKRFGKNVGLISTFLFLTNSFMVYHSLFIWILNYLPVLGLFIFLILSKKENLNSKKQVFVLGILSGAIFALEYAFLFTAIPIVIYLFIKSKHKVANLALFIFGAIIFNLPMIAFDIKHSFYHLTVLWQYALDVFSKKSNTALTYYHFLHFWPAICVLFALLLTKLKSFIALSLVLVIYLYINLSSSYVSFNSAVGMPSESKYFDIENAAKEILKSHPISYNVVSLFDFDSRAHPLRYLLRYTFNNDIFGIDEYEKAHTLYIFTPDKKTYDESRAFELSEFKDILPSSVSTISGKYLLYKIDK